MPLTIFFACMLGFFAIILVVCGFYTLDVEVIYIGLLFIVLALFLLIAGFFIKKEEETTTEDYEPIKEYIQKNHYRSASSHWAAIEKRKFLEVNKPKKY